MQRFLELLSDRPVRRAPERRRRLSARRFLGPTLSKQRFGRRRRLRRRRHHRCSHQKFRWNIKRQKGNFRLKQNISALVIFSSYPFSNVPLNKSLEKVLHYCFYFLKIAQAGRRARDLLGFCFTL